MDTSGSVDHEEGRDMLPPYLLSDSDGPTSFIYIYIYMYFSYINVWLTPMLIIYVDSWYYSL